MFQKKIQSIFKRMILESKLRVRQNFQLTQELIHGYRRILSRMGFWLIL